MSDAAVKQRRRRAIEAATRLLERSGYQVLRLRRCLYDLEAERRKEVRKIMVCLEHESPGILKKAEKQVFSIDCSREVWIYRSRPGKGVFDIKSLT